MLADAGFRVGLNPDDRTITTTTSRREFELARNLLGMTDVELAAMSERAAVAAFLPDTERAALVERVRSGWDIAVPRLVHLAEREVWESCRASGVYLPTEFGAMASSISRGCIRCSPRPTASTPVVATSWRSSLTPT